MPENIIKINWFLSFILSKTMLQHLLIKPSKFRYISTIWFLSSNICKNTIILNSENT